MSKISELFSRPFIPSDYFKTNDRIVIDKESSFGFLMDYNPSNKVTNYQLGHLEPSLELKEKKNDNQIINLLYETSNHQPVIVSFLDIALHIEKKFELDDFGSYCEVVYVRVRDEELFSVAIEAIESDRKVWKIKVSSWRFDKKELWPEGVVFLLKKTN